MGSLMSGPGTGEALTGSGEPQQSIAEAVPAREVVRCGSCLLVQFRTQSDHCRRCAKPLPTFLPFQEPVPQEPAGADDQAFGDAATPMDRATRNRRPAVTQRAGRRRRS